MHSLRLRIFALWVFVCAISVCAHGQTATPTFSPVAGTYTTVQRVTVSDATGGAVIHYTTDSTTPTSSSPVYNHPLIIGATQTLKAIGIQGGSTSAVGSAAYTVHTKTIFSLTTTGSSVSPSPFPPVNRFCCGETWNNLETASGTYNWTTLDGWTTQTAAHTGSVGMYTFNHTPAWANGTSGNTNPPTDVSTGDAIFKAFVGKFMQHTCGVGTVPGTPLVGVCKVKYIEMWNEFNTDVYFTNGTYVQLATMANDAAVIVRQYCGDCYIVAGSVSAGGDGSHSNGQSGTWYTALETFLQDWGAISGASLPDMVSFHAYPSRTNAEPAPFPTTLKSNSFSLCSTNTSNSTCRTAIKDQVNVTNSTTVLQNAAIAAWASHLPVLMTEGGFGLDTQVCDGSDCSATSANVKRLRGAYAAEWAMMLAQQPGLLQSMWYAYNEPNWGTLEVSSVTNTTYTDLTQMITWLNSASSIGTATSVPVTGGNVWTLPLTISGSSAVLEFYDGWLSSHVTSVAFATQQTLAGTTSATGGSVVLTQEPVLLTSPITIPVSASSFSGSLLASGDFGVGVLDVGPAITFSPVAGHYGSSQSVAIAGVPSSGVDLFYTTDGSVPSSAASLYTGALTVAAGETIRVHGESVGTVSQDNGTSSTNWKCVTDTGGTFGGLTCQAGGGVGTTNPSNVTWTWGTTMAEGVSTTASTGETQILYVYTGAACDNCTTLAQDKVIESIGDDTIVANNELDMMQYDSSRARLHMFGLQCNQQPGNAAFGHWQIDNQQGVWWTTDVTDACPLPTASFTHISYEGHWSTSDTTGCGGATAFNNNGNVTGYGCETFDYLTINGVRYHIGVVMNSYTEPGWASFCGNQDQVDLTNTVTSGHNPTTGGRNVQNNNVTCGFGASAVGSAVYTIP